MRKTTATRTPATVSPDALKPQGGAARASGAADAIAAQVDLAALEGKIGYLLRRAQLAVFQDFIASLAELSLRPGQYSALVAIRDNPGRKQSEIAAALAIKRANFVALMHGLERRGLATRRKAEGDGRSHALYLTQAGQKMLARADRLVEEHEQRLVTLIGGEARRDQLGARLRKLAG